MKKKTMLYLLFLLFLIASARKTDKGDQRITFCHCDEQNLCETKTDMPLNAWERGHERNHPNDCLGPCPCACPPGNSAPFAVCTAPDVVCTGESFMIDCSASSDFDGDTLSFLLKFNGNELPLMSSKALTSIGNAGPQEYTIEVSDGCVSSAVSLTVDAINCNEACFDAQTCAGVAACADISRACYTGPAGTEGVGLCVPGTETCSGGVIGACEGEVLPAPTEQCDGFDDTCVGTTDAGFPLGVSCNTGVCQVTGQLVCSADGSGTVCSSFVNKTDGTACATTEFFGTCAAGVCTKTSDTPLAQCFDGVDNDGNGLIDCEDYDCRGVSRDCATGFSGVCALGVETCPADGSSQTPSLCTPVEQNPSEDANCGACGNECGIGGECVSGGCVSTGACPTGLSEVEAGYLTVGIHTHQMPQDAVNAELWKAVGGGGIACSRTLSIIRETDGGGGGGRAIYGFSLGDVSSQTFSLFIPKGAFYEEGAGCSPSEDFVLYNSTDGGNVEIIRAAGGRNGGSYVTLTTDSQGFPSTIIQAPGGEGSLNRLGATQTSPPENGVVGPYPFYEGGGGGLGGYTGPCSTCPGNILVLAPTEGGAGDVLPDGTQRFSSVTLDVAPSGGSSAYGSGSGRSCREIDGNLHTPCDGNGYGWGAVVESRNSGLQFIMATSSAGPGFAVMRYCSACGNGVMDAGEQCDDGNGTSGDGCSSTCQTEA